MVHASSMQLNQLDLIVPDVPGATQALSRLIGIQPSVAEERFAQFDFEALILMLSPDALVPLKEAGGVILHFEIDPATDPLEAADGAGLSIAKPTFDTDWGTRSTLIFGPGGILIDLYQKL